MVNHENYPAYTWDELQEAVFGGENGESNDFSKVFADGMIAPKNALFYVDDVLDRLLDFLVDEPKRLEPYWSGPAADAFGRLVKNVRQFAYDNLHVIRYPYWWQLVDMVRNSLITGRANMNWAWDEGWQFIPAHDENVWVPPEQIPQGYGGEPGYTIEGHYDQVPVAAKWVWVRSRAEEAGRPVINTLVNQYHNVRVQFKDLPLPPPPGKKPSEVQAEADAKKEKEDAKKQADEDRKKAEDDKKAFDKKAEDDKKAADKRFDDAQKAQQKQFDDAQKQAADQANQPPPGGGEIPKPGDVPPPPPEPGGPGGGEIPNPGELPPPELGAAGGGAPDPLAGGAPREPAPVPTFFGGAPVPGGIDLDGDGKPELDENGDPLPGVELSKIPTNAIQGPPPSVFYGGPPTFPPGTIFRPPPPSPSVAEIKDGKSLADGADGNPFSPGAFDVPDAGPDASGAGRLGPVFPGAGVPGMGLPGMAGMPGMGSGGMGYPPPMGGGMSPAGMGGQQGQERERQSWLLEDDEVWAEDALETGVLGRVTDDEEDEYSPQGLPRAGKER
jgi:hypothetical protein